MTPRTLTLTDSSAIAWCVAFWPLRAAEDYDADTLALAVEAYNGLAQLGVSGVPFTVVADWALSTRRGWLFPFRSLERGGVSATERSADDAPERIHRTYERLLNAFQLDPIYRGLRDCLRQPAPSLASEARRLTLWLEMLVVGPNLASRLPVRPQLGRVGGDVLLAAATTANESANQAAAERAERADDVDAIAGAEAATAERARDARWRPADLGALAAAMGDGADDAAVITLLCSQMAAIVDLLAGRLLDDPRETRERLNLAELGLHADAIPARLIPSETQLYELSHADIFQKRSDRLRARALGLVAERLGRPPALPRLSRVRVPDVAVMAREETHFPAGGSAGLATRGAPESIVPSELLYLDSEPGEPDLFSLKFVENELLYFVRDEGVLVQRRRRASVVVWDVAAFALKLPQQPISIEFAIEGLLLHTLRDAFARWRQDGLSIDATWVGTTGDATRGTLGPAVKARADAGDIDNEATHDRLFALLFANEVTRGDMRVRLFAEPTMAAPWVLAPLQRTAPCFYLLLQVPGGSAFERPWELTGAADAIRARCRGGRPVFALHIAIDGLTDDRADAALRDAGSRSSIDPFTAAMSRLPLPPRVSWLGADRAIAGLHHLRVAYSDARDPYPALRDLRDALLTLLALWS